MENFIGNLKDYLSAGSALAYPAAYVAGVLISFTPCVYPIIPIQLGFIGGRTAANSEGVEKKAFSLNGFTLSVLFVFGMSVVYAALGAFAGLTGYACAGELEDGRSRLGRASVIALLGLGGFAIATMMSTMAAIGLIVAAEAGHLPSAAAETLLALREAGSAMLIAGAVTALHPVVWALAYLWHRRSSVRSRYDDLHWSTGTALWFWLLLNAAATAYILWQGPVAQAAS